MLRTYLSKVVPQEYKFKLKALLGKDRYYDWSSVSAQISETQTDGLRVAFMTSSGAHRAGNLLEPALALSLKRRGSDAAVLLCDASLPACNITEYGNQSGRLKKFLDDGPKGTKTCEGCFKLGANTWQTSGIATYTFSQFNETRDLESLPEDFSLSSPIEYKGHDIREHIISASLRFLCRGSFDWNASETRPVILRYLNAARQAVDVAEGFFDEYRPDVVVCFHGIYVPHGVFGQVARSRGIRVVNWNTSYRKRRVLVSNDDTYHKAMCYEPEAKWNVPLSVDQENMILEYLNSREDGSQDWQQFNDNPNKEVLSDKKLNEFLQKYDNRFLLLPNVIWDAQLQYEPSIFATMGDWVIETIKAFKDLPNSGLIIRIHPAEVRRYSPTREPLQSIIDAAFPNGVPDNVYIIAPFEDHSTYRLAELSNAAIIYGTKTGLELSANGLPVIVCGEAWIKGKGISFDPQTVEQYLEILKRGDLKMSPEMITRAIRFAYHFFERAALEMPFLKSTNGDLVLEIDPESVASIIDGSSPALEKLCSEIEHDKGLFIGGKA
jgi:hypothetical protein